MQNKLLKGNIGNIAQTKLTFYLLHNTVAPLIQRGDRGIDGMKLFFGRHAALVINMNLL